MDKRILGNTDLSVTKVALGTWGMGGDYFGQAADNESVDAIRAALDAGINLIDTAPAYGRGHAERLVGKAIKGYRGKYVLATKCGIVRHGKDYLRILDTMQIEAEIDQSLKRLGVDVIDLYQMHYFDEKTPLEDSVAALLKLKDAGKIRYIGVSNFSPDQISEARKYGDIVSLQPRYSLMERDFEKTGMDYCVKNKIGVLTYGSIGGGVLTGKYKELPKPGPNENRWMFYEGFKEPGFTKAKKLVEFMAPIAEKYNCPVAHIAIAWVLEQPGITTALVGVKNKEQAIENAKAMEVQLTRDEVDAITKKCGEVS